MSRWARFKYWALGARAKTRAISIVLRGEPLAYHCRLYTVDGDADVMIDGEWLQLLAVVDDLPMLSLVDCPMETYEIQDYPWD